MICFHKRTEHQNNINENKPTESLGGALARAKRNKGNHI